MSGNITHRRLRRKIDSEDLRQRHQKLLQDPSAANIDKFVAGLSGAPILQDRDYSAARYLLAIIHSAKTPRAATVFTDMLALYLTGDLDVYNIRLVKLERQMLKFTDNNDTTVLGPSKKTQKPSTVLSPKHVDAFDRSYARKTGGR